MTDVKIEIWRNDKRHFIDETSGGLIRALHEHGGIIPLIAHSQLSEARTVLSQVVVHPEQLHFSVTRLMLDRGELDDAEKLIESVEDTFLGNPRLDALNRLLERLRIAQKKETVHPAWLPSEEKWTDLTLLEISKGEDALKRGMAARIESVDEEKGRAHVKVGVMIGNRTEADVSWHTECVRFLEIGVYGDYRWAACETHERCECPAPDLPASPQRRDVCREV